jgi:hypothetical protein
MVESTFLRKTTIEIFGATVKSEPWLSGSREKCELGNNVNHKK